MGHAIARLLGRYAGTLSRYFANLRWYAATLMGDNHYQRYLEHRRRCHPGEPTVSEREYWRMRHDATEKSPTAACC
jgi:uncharacterized short protein YbdD (DUF466 family)